MGKRTVGLNDAHRRVGQDHHNARYTDGEVHQVLELREEGMSYGRIATLMEMPKSTVAMIARGERRCQVPCQWRVHVTA